MTRRRQAWGFLFFTTITVISRIIKVARAVMVVPVAVGGGGGVCGGGLCAYSVVAAACSNPEASCRTQPRRGQQFTNWGSRN